MKPRYTEALHVHRLKLMLKSKKDPCTGCPAAKEFNGSFSSGALWGSHPCNTCRSFVNIPAHSCVCPCSYYSHKAAIRISLAAIERYEEERSKS